MSYSFSDYQGHLDEMLRDAYQQGRDDAAEEVTATDYIKGFRDGKDVWYQKGMEDAIDKFVYMCRQTSMAVQDAQEYALLMSDVERIAEQMKEKKG